MNIKLANLPPRKIRILFSCMMVLVLAICVGNFFDVIVFNSTGNDQCAWRAINDRPNALQITDVVKNGVADRAGIENGDILLKINDSGFVGISAQRLINAVPPGQYATYLIERNGVQMTMRIQILRVFNVFYLAQFLLGLGFLIVGYVVVMTRPQGQVQRMFAHYSIASMMFFGFSTVSLLPGDPLWKGAIIGGAAILGRVLSSAIFVRFFFLFPTRHKLLDSRPLKWSLYLVGCGLIVAYFIGRFTASNAGLVGFIGFYVFYIVGLLLFAYSYFKRVDPIRKKQLRPILLSVVVGITAFVYILIVTAVNPFAIFLYPALFIPSVLIIAVPLAFGYSIFRYRLMDIDLIIKRSLIYGLVTAVIAAIYLVVVYGVGNLLAYFMGTEENRLLNIFAFVLIALAFDPIKRRTQSWIDRSFYRERLNYQRALLEFSRELPHQMNLEQILHSMLNRISDTMHVEKVAVVLCDNLEGCFSVSKGIDPACCEFADVQQGLIDLLRRKKVPQSLHFIGEDSEAISLDETDKEKIIRSGIVQAIPMFLKDRLIGIINVGPKLSGKVYSQEDIDLLSTVAGQAAVAIENARLHKSEIEKQKIVEELSLARRIQQGLLPRANPHFDTLDIAGVSLPALSVGGDYFDYILISPTQLLVVVADVSGKGMAAALYMSKIQGMIQLAARMYASPREMLVHVNRLLYDGIERKSFITMILALFDVTKQSVRICRAGHNRAITGLNGTLNQLQSGGIGLGLERGPIFEHTLEEVEHSLSPESFFVFYSDGLTEAMNEIQEQFGEEEICAILNRTRHLPAGDIQSEMITAVQHFRGDAEQHDDITVVVVKSHQ